MLHILSVVGARPQFIKLAPIVREIDIRNQSGRGSINHTTVHTGQHYDYNMSQVFFDQLGLPRPDYHLGVGSASHGAQTADMLRLTEEALEKENPDVVLVYGDTNSTLAGALAASKMHIPVAHVEAGLRSYNRAMPEEVNRLLVDHTSDLLLCPTETAVKNLRKEGFETIVNDGHLVRAGKPYQSPGPRPVINVGDVMYDLLTLSVEIAANQSNILSDHSLEADSYFVATIHRAESTDDHCRLSDILVSLAELARNVEVVLPLHPRTRESMSRLTGMPFSMSDPPFDVIEPVSYFDMLWLQKHARAVLTDSGGVQKEAFWLGVPCITLRGETEWVETVESGWNVLAGPDPESIVNAAMSAARLDGEQPPYFGTGHTAQTIVGTVG